MKCQYLQCLEWKNKRDGFFFRPMGILCIFLSLTAALSAGTWIPFQVFASNDDQQSPAIYGPIIVWQQWVEFQGTSDWDIIGADISNPETISVFGIAEFDKNQENPAIYDNTVIWQDNFHPNGDTDYDIYMLDLDDPDRIDRPVTDLLFDQINPALFGNTVIWQDNSAGDWDVSMADITDPENVRTYPLTPFEYDQLNAAIYHDTVAWQDDFVWEDNPDGAFNLFGADVLRLNKPMEYLFSALPEDQENVAAFGHLIVWQQKFGSDWDIYAADISNPDNPRIFSIATDTDNAEHPDVDGNLIVWQDDRNGDWDIFGFNLTTQQEFLISDNQPGQKTFSDQTNPRLSGNTVVWQDNLGGKMSIYAVVLNGPEIAQCPEKLPGDANGDCIVNLHDFVLLAQNWLSCNFDQSGACP
ncbi:MAG: hypothetical protein JW828_12985 [Sedimentisphaerales bacterium]|nr:hypothetical protein [Sedimentisphaerales bacterium]